MTDTSDITTTAKDRLEKLGVNDQIVTDIIELIASSYEMGKFEAATALTAKDKEIEATLAIEAAIASGALVPASSVDNTTRATNAVNRIRRLLVSITPEILCDIHGIIQEAMDGMVPASAVAEMRERCEKAVHSIKIRKSEASEYNLALCHASAAIRQLDLAPASGEYVVVPRIPTDAMIRAGDEAGGGAGMRFCTPVTDDIWNAMLNAASSNGGEK